MTFSRRRFPFALGAATFCFSNPSALAQVSGQASEQVNSPNGGRYFFQDENFETIFLTSLGRAYHSGGDVGRVPSTGSMTSCSGLRSWFRSAIAPRTKCLCLGYLQIDGPREVLIENNAEKARPPEKSGFQ
jgi:hypothetical protein